MESTAPVSPEAWAELKGQIQRRELHRQQAQALLRALLAVATPDDRRIRRLAEMFAAVPLPPLPIFSRSGPLG